MNPAETDINKLADYYAANVKDAKTSGYVPADWRHLDANYWRSELMKQPNKDGHLV